LKALQNILHTFVGALYNIFVNYSKMELGYIYIVTDFCNL